MPQEPLSLDERAAERSASVAKGSKEAKAEKEERASMAWEGGCPGSKPKRLEFGVA
jgi:hypothetical protein